LAGPVNQQIADDVVSRAIDLLRYDSQLRTRVIVLLLALRDEIVAELLASEIDSGRVLGSARGTLDALLAKVEDGISAAYGAIASDQAEAASQLASVEADFAASLLAKAQIYIDFETKALTTEQLAALAREALVMGAPAQEWWSRQGGDLLQRYTDQIRLGVANGESIDKLVRRIRGRATGARNSYEVNGETRTFVEFRGGVIDTATRNAESLVRTSVASVSAASRRAFYEANGDVVQGVVQISVLDDRTTIICIARAGKAWKLDGTPIGHDIPYAGGLPQHWQERSSEAPVLRALSEFGIDASAIKPIGAQRALDGEVPADFSFEDWLKRRTLAQQDAQLGPGRAELWRAGKISLSDLLNGHGQPLTLEDLRASVH
jgi:hypothetical protein